MSEDFNSLYAKVFMPVCISMLKRSRKSLIILNEIFWGSLGCSTAVIMLALLSSSWSVAYLLKMMS